MHSPHNKRNDFHIIGDIHPCGAEEVGVPSEPIVFQTNIMNIGKKME